MVECDMNNGGVCLKKKSGVRVCRVNFCPMVDYTSELRSCVKVEVAVLGSRP